MACSMEFIVGVAFNNVEIVFLGHFEDSVPPMNNMITISDRFL